MIDGWTHWVVAATAVRDYRSRNEVRALTTGPRAVPPGYLSLAAFAEAAGLSWGTLYRRIAAGEIRSVRIGTRRLIPAGELERVRRIE